MNEMIRRDGKLRQNIMRNENLRKEIKGRGIIWSASEVKERDEDDKEEMRVINEMIRRDHRLNWKEKFFKKVKRR